MHAMRCPGQTIGEAKRKMERFIEKMTQRQKRLKCEGKTREANVAFGMALHPVMDSTSPTHEGYQIWYGIKGPITAGRGGAHWLGEQYMSKGRKKGTRDKMSKLLTR